MNREVEEFLASRSFAETTEDTYRRVLVDLSALDLSVLSAADLVRFVRRPAWNSSTQYTALCACRMFLRWRFGESHPALAARVKRITASPQPRLSAEQVRELLASLDAGSVEGLRDRALVGVALDCNLRASELCSVEIGNVHLNALKLYALVKGGQWAWKVFSPATAEFVRAWLDVRSPALGVSAMFLSFHHQRRGMPLTRSGLQQVMASWGRRVGFHVSPHMFRRSHAMLATLNGAPKNIVKASGGWKSDKMVDHYIGELELEAARPYLPMQKLHTP